MSFLYLSLGLRVEFLVGFREEHDPNDPTSIRDNLPPAPDTEPPLIRLPARTAPDSHDPLLFNTVVRELEHGTAISSYVLGAQAADGTRADLVTLNGLPLMHAAEVLWGCGRWFVTSSALSVGPLVPIVQQDARRRSPLVPPHPLYTYSWRPLALTRPLVPVHYVFPLPYIDKVSHRMDAGQLQQCKQRAEQRAKTIIKDPLTRLRSSFLTQLNETCALAVLIGVGIKGREQSLGRLLALKKLATILWLGGEARLAKLAIHPARWQATNLLTETAILRVLPEDALFVLGEDAGDAGDAVFYDEWVAPLLGAAPRDADVREQMRRRGLAEFVLQRQNSGNIGRFSPTDPARVALYRQFGVDDELIVPHEIYLIWRAPSVDALARILTPHFWVSPVSVPQEFCAVDFTALRDDVCEARPGQPPVLAFRLFAASLDPALIFAWSRLCAALAHRGAHCSSAEFLSLGAQLFRGSRSSRFNDSVGPEEESIERETARIVAFVNSLVDYEDDKNGKDGKDGDGDDRHIEGDSVLCGAVSPPPDRQLIRQLMGGMRTPPPRPVRYQRRGRMPSSMSPTPPSREQRAAMQQAMGNPGNLDQPALQLQTQQNPSQALLTHLAAQRRLIPGMAPPRRQGRARNQVSAPELQRGPMLTMSDQQNPNAASQSEAHPAHPARGPLAVEAVQMMAAGHGRALEAAASTADEPVASDHSFLRQLYGEHYDEADLERADAAMLSGMFGGNGDADDCVGATGNMDARPGPPQGEDKGKGKCKSNPRTPTYADLYLDEDTKGYTSDSPPYTGEELSGQPLWQRGISPASGEFLRPSDALEDDVFGGRMIPPGQETAAATTESKGKGKAREGEEEEDNETIPEDEPAVQLGVPGPSTLSRVPASAPRGFRDYYKARQQAQAALPSFNPLDAYAKPAPSSSGNSPPGSPVSTRSNGRNAFTMWSFVRWLDVGSETEATLREFVTDHGRLNPADQPAPDGVLRNFLWEWA